MTAINVSAKPIQSTFASRLWLAAKAVGGAGRAFPSVFRLWPGGQSWSGLNDHLLRDIGETPARAENEAARNLSYSPLGTLGLGGRLEAGERRRFRRPASPLG